MKYLSFKVCEKWFKMCILFYVHCFAFIRSRLCDTLFSLEEYERKLLNVKSWEFPLWMKILLNFSEGAVFIFVSG